MGGRGRAFRFCPIREGNGTPSKRAQAMPASSEQSKKNEVIFCDCDAARWRAVCVLAGGVGAPREGKNEKVRPRVRGLPRLRPC